MCLQMFLKLYWPIIIMLLKLLTNMCSFFFKFMCFIDLILFVLLRKIN